MMGVPLVHNVQYQKVVRHDKLKCRIFVHELNCPSLVKRNTMTVLDAELCK